ncbi:MAG: gliding motility-associated C-terminal domain-containing protein [Bacteroidota bacterium]
MLSVFSQSVSPQVINSAGGGGAVGTSGMEVYYNIGEPLHTTISNGNDVITQGFLQPDIVGEFGLTASAFITPASCADKTDGAINISARLSGVANPGNFKISYYWNSTAVCSSATTCSTVANLPAGTYSVLVVSNYTGSGNALPNDTVIINDIIVSGSSEPCQITVYNGVSPNGDGMNDFFYIENIGAFTENKVEIFNRWGQKLSEIKHYDNTTNFWKGTIGAGNELAPSGTYFYVIDLGNGTAPIKGWLELTSHK